MSSELSNKADSVTPPSQVICLAQSATTTAAALPATFQKNWITVQAEGQDLYIRFAAERAGVAPAGTISKTAVSTPTGTDLVVAATATGGILIPAGEERTFDLRQLKVPNGFSIRLYHIGTAGGYIRLWQSSGYTT